VLVFPSAFANRQSLVRAMKKSGAVQVASEGPYLVCKVRDPKILSELSGIAVAKQVPRRFSDVTGAIVEAGEKAIMTGEKFYVKAILTAKADYVERDVEFASAGALVEKLAKVNALPARNEQEADRLILAVVGKRSAYVCVRGRT
jgi:hypothetical protein